MADGEKQMCVFSTVLTTSVPLLAERLQVLRVSVLDSIRRDAPWQPFESSRLPCNGFVMLLLLLCFS